MKAVGARIGYGMFPIHGEDEGGVCAGNSQSWARTLPGDVKLGPLVGDRCSPWLKVASLGGLGTQICAVLYLFLNVKGDTLCEDTAQRPERGEDKGCLGSKDHRLG